MRMPLVRFGRDDRPVEPWEEHFAPIVIPVMFAAVLLMSAFGLCLVLGWAALSPVLPQAWRLDWDRAFELDPSVDAECPKCQAGLILGQPDKGYRVRTEGSQDITKTIQGATCPQCRRVYRRFSLGKIWSSWHEADA